MTVNLMLLHSLFLIVLKVVFEIYAEDNTCKRND